MHMLHR